MKGLNSALKRRLRALTAAAMLICTALGANAAVIFPKVTNTNDTGSGSLRAAITASNANGADGAIIEFQIGSSCGPHVIHLNTVLPDLTSAVHIEGYTQAGSSKNTYTNPYGNTAVICIVLAGDNLVADGLTVPSTVADSMEMSVQGVAFSGFTHSAVNLRGGSDHVVAGIRTGGTVGGFAMQTDSYGVILAAGVHGATIGGSDVGDVNQLADITHNAVYVESSSGSNVASHGNTIAFDNVGYVFDDTGATVLLPTGGAAFAIGGYSNTIENNYAIYSGAAGLHISNTDAHDNDVEDNGFEYGNADGVLIDDDAHDNKIIDNALYHNAGAGIRVVNGQGNRFQDNNIDSNGGLGIDLADVGVTPDDNDSMPPAADYANRGLNFPILQTAGGAGGKVTGTLTTTPGDYYINIQATTACNASGYGAGQNFFTYTSATFGYKVTVPNITAQGQGSTSFSIPVTAATPLPKPLYVTATTTDASGNTSEFSACLLYTEDSIFYDGFE
jgi:parallel beta-helix repeat protein